MSHPALVPGAVAIVTGGASCTAWRTPADSPRLAFTSASPILGRDRLTAAGVELRDGAREGAQIADLEVDVSDREALVSLEAAIADRFGSAAVVMANAAI